MYTFIHITFNTEVYSITFNLKLGFHVVCSCALSQNLYTNKTIYEQCEKKGRHVENEIFREKRREIDKKKMHSTQLK